MTLYGKILAILNILAAAGFGYLALLSHGKRQTWALAVDQHDRAIEGQPLQEQYNDPFLPRNMYLANQARDPNSASLKDAFQSAGAAGKPINVQKKLIEEVSDRSNPDSFFAAMTAAAKKAAQSPKKDDALKALLFPMAMNGAQLEKLQKKVSSVAKDPVKQGQLLEDGTKRHLFAQVLLPLEEFRPGGNRDSLANDLANLDKPTSEFEKLLSDRLAALLSPVPQDPSNAKKTKERAIIVQLVTSANVAYKLKYQRFPKEQKVLIFLLDNTGKEAQVSASPVQLTLSNVEKQPTIDLAPDGKRFSAKASDLGTTNILSCVVSLTLSGKQERFLLVERDLIDHKQNIALALLAVSQVKKSDGKPLLDSLGDARLEVVVGRKRFNHAVELLTLSYQQTAERRREQISADLRSFIIRYDALVKDRLPYLITQVNQQNKIRDEWKKLKEDRSKILEKRQEDLSDAEKKFKEERGKTTAALKELTRWQERLFLAQKRGTGLLEENLRLEAELRKLEIAAK